MAQRDHDHDAPRRPIRVTPGHGPGAPLPEAGLAPAAADAATARLVSMLHELNNLLDGATRTLALARQSLGELAIAPGVDPAIAVQIETASTALEQMGELLHAAMRPASAVVAGASDSRTTLVEVIEHTIQSHRPLAGERRIELRAEVSPRLVLASAGPIYPAIANAIRNAIEAIARSGLGSRVELIAELDVEHHQQPQVQIDIVDDGPGPDAAAREHAFEPGFSIKPDGFGVGLALARQIIDALDGTITLEPRSPDDPLRPGGRGGHVRIRYPQKP